MLIFFLFLFICLYASSNPSFLSVSYLDERTSFQRNSPATLQCAVHFVSEQKNDSATLQRSRIRLVKKLTGELMRVNKLSFMKENTLFRQGNSTVRELTAKQFWLVRKLWFYQGDEQARGNLLYLCRYN